MTRTIECATYNTIDKKYCPDPCKRGSFYCGVGQKCVDDALKCDSNDDCGNWKDEDGCKITPKNSRDDIDKNTILRRLEGRGKGFPAIGCICI